MIDSIIVDRNVSMQMRDGIMLKADIYRPVTDRKCPAVLIRTPYDKLKSGSSDFLNPCDAAFAGISVAIQDIRGRFASEGKYGEGEALLVEGKDGYDSVEWLAKQEWCNGNVGMAGGSYQALLQWITAVFNPPHLKAISPWIHGAGPIREQMLLGGAMPLHLDAQWAPMMALDVADKLEKQGKNVSEMRRKLKEAIRDKDSVFNYLPLKDVPHFQFEGIEQIWRNIFLNAVPNPAMAAMSRWPYEKIMVPCLYVGGWYDLHTWAPFENWHSMREKGGSEQARNGQHILIGAWAHGDRLPAYLGDMHFGNEAGAIGGMISERIIAFFNRYLANSPLPIPAIRYFTMGSNLWHETATWPPGNVVMQKYYLHSKNRANTCRGDGILNNCMPKNERPDKFLYDPHNPVPSMGGRVVPAAGLVAGPVNQCNVEKRQDVLCYTTYILSEDIEVTGQIEMHIFASTTAVDTDFNCKLIDVYPDGSAYNYAEGIMRARYRKSVFQPLPIVPGEVNEYVINMGNVSCLFKKGHQVRVDISSSNFPAYDRNMNTGNAVGEDTIGNPASQIVYHNQHYPSYIILPVVTYQAAC